VLAACSGRGDSAAEFAVCLGDRANGLELTGKYDLDSLSSGPGGAYSGASFSSAMFPLCDVPAIAAVAPAWSRVFATEGFRATLASGLFAGVVILSSGSSLK
jgi:hypothetical protein